MKFRFLFFILIGNCYAKPPLEDLYAFIDYFNAKTYHLCPLRGAVGIESSWIKNLLLTGDESHATFQLASRLFNRELLKVSGELTPTTYEPYCHFGFKIIATLLLRLHRGTLNRRNKKNEYSALEEIKKTLKGKKKKYPALAELIDLIMGAERESQDNKYPPFTAHQVLMSFFNLKAQKGRELRDFCREIREHLHISPVETARQKPWTEDDYLEFITWCEQPIKENEGISEPFLEPERLIFCLSKELSRSSLTPPTIFYYYQNIDGKEIGDCVEAALRRMCSIILYNATTKSLDISLLQEKHQEHVPVAFSNFFQTAATSTSQEINSALSRNSWYRIISNLDGIVYRLERKDGTKCEIHPSSNNLHRALCYIFGLPQLEDEITQNNAFSSWEHFCKQLSEVSSLDLKCINVWYQSDTTNAITFSLKEKNKSDGETVTFTLHIQPEHAWITLDNQQDYRLCLIQDGKQVKKKKALLTEYLLKSYAESPSPITLDLLHLLSPYLKISDMLQQTTQNIPLYLSHPTKNNKDFLRHIKRLLAYVDSPESLLWPYIFKQINYFYNDLYTRQALCAIIQKNIKNLLAAENIRGPLISATGKLIEREKAQETSNILNNQQSFAMFLALIHKQTWKYDGYTQLIIKLLNLFPEFEDYKIDIDCKVFGLLQLLIFDGHQNTHLREEFMRSLNSLSHERALMLYNRTIMSPFSLYEDEDSVKMREELETWKAFQT